MTQIFLTAIIIAAITYLVVFLYWKNSDDRYARKMENRRKIDNEISQIPNFNIAQSYSSYDEESKILIDENDMKICFYKLGETPRIYDYRDILKSEITHDGHSVLSTNRGSQLGGALLGGILAGGVGAIIGGLSGSQSSDEYIKTIEVLIVVNDIKNPIYKIEFLSLDVPLPKENIKEYIDKATYCHNLISVLIKQADNKDLAEAESNIITETTIDGSISDELKKLNSLKEQGILTEEEFTLAKKKLIS